MFRIEQIKTAHSKVKSGADFPAYIRDIKQLGVIYYETFVSNGNTTYHGANNYSVSGPVRYQTMKVSAIADLEKFKLDLLAHQQGKTDFITFCTDCAKLGIEKWDVCLEKVTCSYYDKAGKVILVEQIPQ